MVIHFGQPPSGGASLHNQPPLRIVGADTARIELLTVVCGAVFPLPTSEWIMARRSLCRPPPPPRAHIQIAQTWKLLDWAEAPACGVLSNLGWNGPTPAEMAL